jgi:hypothetical protein
MTNIDPEKFIEELNKLKMTPQERRIANAEEIGRAVGKIVIAIIALFAIPTIIWAVLTYIFAINIAWVKVFGAYFLFDLFRAIIRK